MAKKNKSTTASNSKGWLHCPLEVLRSVGRFAQFAWLRLKRYPAGPASNDSGHMESRRFSSPVRFIFMLVAAPVLALFLLLLLYAMLAEGDLEQLKHSTDSSSRFKYLILEHQTVVIFISTCVVALQLMAILGALFNWTTVLFSYVVITGLLGTIVGVVGICGIVISCLLMSHRSQSDHSIMITVATVIAFVLLFYLLTILGLKLISYMRRRMDASAHGGSGHEEYGPRRCGRPYKNSPVARRGHKRPSYKSIDAISVPFNPFHADEQELSHVYVESNATPSLKTLLPQSPTSPPDRGSGTGKNSSVAATRASFMFEV